MVPKHLEIHTQNNELINGLIRTNHSSALLKVKSDALSDQDKMGSIVTMAMLDLRLTRLLKYFFNHVYATCMEFRIRSYLSTKSEY